MQRSKHVTPAPTEAGSRGAWPVVVILALRLAAGMLSGQNSPTNSTPGGPLTNQSPAELVADHFASTEGAANGLVTPETGPGKREELIDGFQQFAVISDRNIFNPNRTRHSRSSESEAAKPRVPKVDLVSLSGTIIYAKGNFAFFDSTANEFRKAVETGGKIAGYTVRDIHQSRVALERGNESIHLEVGEQLRREDEGEWQVTRGVSFSSGDDGASNTESRGSPTNRDSLTSGSNAPTSGDASEGASDVLKRLLEKRKKEQAQ